MSCIGYIASRRKMSLNDELGNIWQKAAMDYFKLLSQHFNGMMEENHEEN
jgi:hypothetical protein